MFRLPARLVSLAITLLALLGLTDVAQAQWTSLNNAPPGFLDTSLVLTDGRVFCHEYDSNAWFILTPDIDGSYANGTWTASATMPDGTDSTPACTPSCTYRPLYFGSCVLASGKVVVVGGEYNPAATWTPIGFIYDPETDSWSSQLVVPFQTTAGSTRGCIGDAQIIVLENGTMLLADSLCSRDIAGLTESTGVFTALGPTGKADSNNEENWNILPNGLVFTMDARIVSQYELYNPITNNWTSGSTPFNMADTSTNTNSREVGPGVLRPDGTMVYFSGNSTGRNGIYDVATDSWFAPLAGTDFPLVTAGDGGDGTFAYSVADGPASLLPNGNVLVMASPVTNLACPMTAPPPPPLCGVFNSPSHFYELDLATNLLAPVTDSPNAASFISYQGRMVLLPTGEVLLTAYNQGATQDVMLYSNGGAPEDAWRPVITTGTAEVIPGTTYTISGRLFNGFSEGATYGDDAAMSTNYPLVRIKNDATGHVFYARTHDHSSMGVEYIDTVELRSTSFEAPMSLEMGPSELCVVVNGIASEPIHVNCLAPPVLTVPGDVLFDDTCVGDTDTQTLYLCNTGGMDCENLRIESITSSDSQFSVSLPSSGFRLGLNPGFCFRLQVRFTPSAPGPQVGFLTLVSNDPAQPELVVMVSGDAPEPDIDTLFRSNGSFGDVCPGSFRDLPLTIHNSGECALNVANITSDSGEFRVASVLSYPLSIAAGTSLTVQIRFEPSGIPGPKNATIRVFSDDLDTPTAAVAVSGDTPLLDLDLQTESLDFGDTLIGMIATREVVILNSGGCSAQIDSVIPGAGSTDISLSAGGFFPFTLSAGESVSLWFQYEPTDFGSDATHFDVNFSTDSSRALQLGLDFVGNSPAPDIRVSGSTDFGTVCPGDLVEKDIVICNVGFNHLNVTSVALDGMCEDFELINSPFHAPISHDFCLPLTIRYTPTGANEPRNLSFATAAGPGGVQQINGGSSPLINFMDEQHECTLTITTDDPDMPVIELQVTGTTPPAMIEIPTAITFEPTVVNQVDPNCYRSVPYPITNHGICPVTITEIDLYQDSDDYELVNLVPLPITVQPGHTASDLIELKFAPNQIKHQIPATLTVTYIDHHPLIGDTNQLQTYVCGEGVSTGLRVVVLDGGVTVADVDEISLYYVLNPDQKDEQFINYDSNAGNALQTVAPIGACVGFEFHREWGGESNPYLTAQKTPLPPGRYKVEARLFTVPPQLVKGFFEVSDTCTFLPTAFLDFNPPGNGASSGEL